MMPASGGVAMQLSRGKAELARGYPAHSCVAVTSTTVAMTNPLGDKAWPVGMPTMPWVRRMYLKG